MASYVSFVCMVLGLHDELSPRWITAVEQVDTCERTACRCILPSESSTPRRATHLKTREIIQSSIVGERFSGNAQAVDDTVIQRMTRLDGCCHSERVKVLAHRDERLIMPVVLRGGSYHEHIIDSMCLYGSLLMRNFFTGIPPSYRLQLRG